MVKISIVIPVYNTEKYLADCLNSVMNQTIKDIEVICIDDGSTDSSLDSLKEYQKKHGNVIVIEQENKGAGNARNKGIEMAQGEYIAFMDSDDFYYNNNVLEILYQKAKENNVDVCGGGICHMAEGSVRLPLSEFRHGSVFLTEGIILFKDYQYIYGFTRFIYKLSMLKNGKILFPEYAMGEDLPFMLNALIAAERLYAVKDIVYCARYVDKKIRYEAQENIDGMMQQFRDILKLSVDNQLEKLHVDTVNEIMENWAVHIYKQVLQGNESIHRKIQEINALISNEFFGINGKDCTAPRLLEREELNEYIREKKKIADEFQLRVSQYNEILIYGALKKGKAIYDYIKSKMSSKTIKFVVSNLIDKTATARGERIYEIDKLPYEKDAIVVIAVSPNFCEEIKQNLLRLGYENYIKADYDALQLFS